MKTTFITIITPFFMGRFVFFSKIGLFSFCKFLSQYFQQKCPLYLSLLIKIATGEAINLFISQFVRKSIKNYAHCYQFCFVPNAKKNGAHNFADVHILLIKMLDLCN